MKIFWLLFTYEWRHFKAAKGLVLLTALVLLVGLYGIYYGTTEIGRQRQHLAELPTLARHNVEELQGKFPGRLMPAISATTTPPLPCTTLLPGPASPWVSAT
ncbi:hypothetical protein [Hymenobacter volaticus]|uniref:ABC transporter permease n=1 Tax=Hymenobacter volaticus TaxID=2932254 RepID=A0ABY4GES8_9BACT|nr:hypothetical protein [Hymenobacter volaticus]UOQ69256.1 hypothetical protein MUN86_27780 [Hymenobacter volaticus]